LTAGKSLLEYGVGKVGFSGFYAERCAQVVALDVVYHSASHAKKPYWFIKYDGDRIPLGDRLFHIVASHSVLEHVASIEDSLSEIDRVLKVGAWRYCVGDWIRGHVVFGLPVQVRPILKTLSAFPNVTAPGGDLDGGHYLNKLTISQFFGRCRQPALGRFAKPVPPRLLWAKSLVSCVSGGGKMSSGKCLIVLVIVGPLLWAAPPEGTAQPREASPPPERVEDEGSKACSVVDPGNWRDTILVPDSWEFEDCVDFAISVSARAAQPACIFQTGLPKFSFGTEDGRPPPRNCRWHDGRMPGRRR